MKCMFSRKLMKNNCISITYDNIYMKKHHQFVYKLSMSIVFFVISFTKTQAGRSLLFSCLPLCLSKYISETIFLLNTAMVPPLLIPQE
jgi:hypothetical protein